MRIALLTLTLLLFTKPAIGDSLSVEIHGNRSPGATLYIAVYAGAADDWESPPVARHKARLPDQRTLTVTLELEPGSYALRAFVDLDGDEEMDLNTRDRPLEPYGSSVGEGSRRPSIFFSRSIFRFDRERSHLELALRYPQGAEELSTAQ